MLYAALVLSLMANVATVLAWRQMRKKWRWEQRAAEALATRWLREQVEREERRGLQMELDCRR